VNALTRVGQRIAGAPRARQRHRALELVRRSSLFDQDWYLANYPDVESSGVDPIVHYLEFGWKEGRDPGPRFSTSAYLRANSDVAASGMNPLLHYVEYGHSEGRGAPEHGAPAPSPVRPREAFGPAAPVPSFPTGQRVAAGWRRAGQPVARESDQALIDGYFICKFRTANDHKGFDAALARLAFLSGGATRDGAPARGPRKAAPGLVDAWFVASNRLRSRWRSFGEDSVVVRAIQHVRTAPTIVGEGLAVGELDVIDAVLVNAMFPLLFVFTTVEGELIGTQLMTFPSMCRGGLHYPELLALDKVEGRDGGALDLLDIVERLGAELAAARDGQRALLVRNIEVDLAEADGTHPIFQEDVQAWLERVFGVAVDGVNAPAGPAGEYLVQAVQVSGGERRANAAGTLRIGSEMVPAISALVADVRNLGEDAKRISVVLSGEDPAVPALLLSLPTKAARSRSSGFAPPYPCLEGADADCIVAIRLTGGRPLADAQMLVPVAPPQLEIEGTREPVTWLVATSPDREQEALQCVEAIAAQSGTGAISIVFVGPASSLTESLARRLMKGRVQVAAGFKQAARAVQTPLVGYIGSGVIMHDSRTTGFLCKALADDALATASVLLVTAENRGKQPVVAAVDAGEILLNPPVRRQQMQQIASLLWRSAWPVAVPPRDLWLTRTATLMGWLSRSASFTLEQTHLCSYQLSASYSARPARKEPEFTPPRSQSSAMHGELLFG
jgi:hypothetical protein